MTLCQAETHRGSSAVDAPAAVLAQTCTGLVGQISGPRHSYLMIKHCAHSQPATRGFHAGGLRLRWARHHRRGIRHPLPGCQWLAGASRHPAPGTITGGGGGGGTRGVSPPKSDSRWQRRGLNRRETRADRHCATLCPVAGRGGWRQPWVALTPSLTGSTVEQAGGGNSDSVASCWPLMAAAHWLKLVLGSRGHAAFFFPLTGEAK